MLNQFTLYKQCAAPTPTNVFLPTSSATALTDFLTALEASSQYLTATDNPLMAEINRIRFEGDKAELDNLIAALNAVNNPWYKVGKAARKLFANLVGWEDKVDPDLLLAEEIIDNHAEIEQLSKKFSDLFIDIETRDLPNIRETYLDGVIRSSLFDCPELVDRLEKYEYTEGRTINLMTHKFQQKEDVIKSSQPAAQDEQNGFNEIQKSKSSYRI